MNMWIQQPIKTISPNLGTKTTSETQMKVRSEVNSYGGFLRPDGSNFRTRTSVNQENSLTNYQEHIQLINMNTGS